MLNQTEETDNAGDEGDFMMNVLAIAFWHLQCLAWDTIEAILAWLRVRLQSLALGILLRDIGLQKAC